MMTHSATMDSSDVRIEPTISPRIAILVLIIALFVGGCSSSPPARTGSPSVRSTPAVTPEAENASIDSVQEFLLESAGSDFHKHGPKPIDGFRELHLKRLALSNGATSFMLCGQFHAEQQGRGAQWIPFVTIKTSGYEQYIGATMYCQEGSVVPGRENDLSALLQARFDSLK